MLWGLSLQLPLWASLPMSAARLAHLAFQEADWAAHWEGAGESLRTRLKAHGLADPLTWAGLGGDRDRLQRILSGLGVIATALEVHSTELDICVGLQAAARTAGEHWIERAASQNNFQLATDVELAAKRRKTDAESAMLTRLQATAVIMKPVEWKGRRFCRPEVEGDENARKKGWRRQIGCGGCSGSLRSSPSRPCPSAERPCSEAGSTTCRRRPDASEALGPRRSRSGWRTSGRS